jgi:hypothetical protein
MAQDRKQGARSSCAVCGRPRPTFAVRHGDPYCSARCAKRAHRVRDSFGTSEDRNAACSGKAMRQRQRAQRVWRRAFHAWAARRLTCGTFARAGE